MGRRSFMTLNRESNWNRGVCVGLLPTLRGLVLETPGQIARGVFYTAALDSREGEFLWDRMILEGEFPPGVMTSVRAFASDSPCDQPDEIGGLLRRVRQTPAPVLLRQLDDCYMRRYDGTADLLLTEKGRYLWLRVELFAARGGDPCLTGIHVQYAGDHMIDYLPAIYGGEGRTGFTYRFLSAFNSMSLDLEDEIYRTPARFDDRRASGEMLRFLAVWVGLDSAGLGDEQLRAQIAQAVRGGRRFPQTPRGIREQVRLWTGREPILLEYFQVRELARRGEDRALYERLYGTEPGVFFLLMEEEAFPTSDGRERFLQQLERVVPANVKPRLVLLGRDAYLDLHTYLEVNSVVGGFNPVATDSGVSIHYDTMIGGSQLEKP